MLGRSKMTLNFKKIILLLKETQKIHHKSKILELCLRQSLKNFLKLSPLSLLKKFPS